MAGVAATVAALAPPSRVRASAQEATPDAGQCVATAPPLEDGIGFVQLLVSSVTPNMPAVPVEVRISRLAMAPGMTILGNTCH